MADYSRRRGPQWGKMMRLDVRRTAAQGHRLFNRPELIVRYAGSAWGAVSVPLPITLSIYRCAGSDNQASTFDLLSPPARKACQDLLEAVHDERKTIALVGPTRETLSMVLRTTLASANFKLVRSENVSSWGKLISDLRLQSSIKDGNTPERFMIVVGEAQMMPSPALQSLVDSLNEFEEGLIQAVIVGFPTPDKPSGKQTSAGVQTTITLVGEPVPKYSAPSSRPLERPPQEHSSGLEGDLVRGWQNSAAFKRREVTLPVYDEAARSPYPELAAFLGQPHLPRRRWRWVKVLALLAVTITLVFALSGALARHPF